ncbi:histidine phosphatase family protein [Kutzneria viridogrisea]
MVTMNRIFLISHGATQAVREARFADDESLCGTTDPLETPSRVDEVRCGPERRCLETATVLGLTPVTDPGLSDLDCGSWRARALAEVQEQDPAGLMAWLSDPDADAHGGETVRQLLARVGSWLDCLPDRGRIVAITSPSVVRAAIVHCVQAPPASFWRFDVAPLTLTHLYGGPGRWTLRETGHPLPPARTAPPS